MSTAPTTKIEEKETGTDSELPEGWAVASLEELSTLVTKGTTPTSLGFNYKDRGVPFVRVENLSNGVINRATIDKFIDESTDEALSRSRLQTGDLLFSIAGTIGRTALVSESDVPANTNQALAIIRGTSSALLPKFLMFALSSHLGQQQAESEARGGSMNNISLGDVRAISLPIPPLAEQERIEKRVEELQHVTEMSTARLARVSVLLKTFRQAVLAAACSGKLTEEWRETNPGQESVADLIRRIFDDRKRRFALEKGNSGSKRQFNLTRSQITNDVPDVPSTWEWVTWNDLVDWVTYGFTRPMPHVQQGIPIITAKNIFASRVTFDTADQTTKAAFAELSEKDRPRKGEILLTKDGSIGRAAIVKTEEPFCINQSVAVLRFGGLTAHVPYLLRVIEAPYTQGLIDEEAKGTAIPHISITSFGRFPAPLPPLEEQHEIVRRVEALFKLADAIEKRVAAASARAEKLTQAVLAKAFRGELVPTEAELARREGRGYEPASILLERIKRERAVAETGNGKKREKRAKWKLN